MKNVKSTKGITLIALVITIIVMLILAGVTISLVLDENNGIIKRSQVAVNAYDDGRVKEEGMLQAISNTFNDYLAKIGENGGSSSEPVAANAAYTAGQEVTVTNNGLTQSFYVLENSDATKSTVTLLAKHNLSKTATDGHYRQAPNATSSETACSYNRYYQPWPGYYWKSAYTEWKAQRALDNTIPFLDLNNVTIPSEETVADNAILKARDYATNVMGGISGRLLTYEEVENFMTATGDIYENPIYANPTMANIIIGTSNGSNQDYLIYWLSSISDTQDTYDEDGCGMQFYFDSTRAMPYYDVDLVMGVRPVIEISKTKVSLVE